MAYQRTEISRPSGLNKDLSPYELPPELWSDSANVYFRRNRTEAGVGYENPFTLTDTVIPPLAMAYWPYGQSLYWIYANEGAIYLTDGTAGSGTYLIGGDDGTGSGTGGFDDGFDLGFPEGDALSGAAYSATRESNWSICSMNGVIIFNNENDIPQTTDTSGTPAMIDLPNWNATAPWTSASRCRVMRSYKNYLFALDCTDDNSVNYPNMVRWSSPAQAGDVPPSWDAFVDGEQAGLYTLSDTPGAIVDAQPLGDYFMIYKTDAVWAIQFVGGDAVFSFRKLFSEAGGCLTHDCVAEFEGKHFVLSPSGAYIHNGSTKTEVMEQWVKDEYFLKVSKLRQSETRVVADHANSEVWIYYTTKDSTTGWADRALIWNWETKKWTVKSLSGISYISEGIINVNTTGVESWVSDNNPWNTDTTIWDSDPEIDPTNVGLLLADYENKIFYKSEFQRNGEGINQSSFVKRVGIDFGDDKRFKYITRVIPHIIASNPVTVKMFAEDVQTGKPSLISTHTFNPTEDQDIDCHVVGRYIGIEFSGDEDWVLTGYSLVWETAGEY